jgi:hypothetical protein
MDRIDRIVAWVMLGIAALHCVVTFLLHERVNLAALWFFSAGLAMAYCAALNLLRVEYAVVAPGLRVASAAANLTLLAFMLAYVGVRGLRVLRNPGAVVLVLCVALVTAFSLSRRPAARRAALTSPNAAA